MTYKTYAVTTVVTDNELAKHLDLAIWKDIKKNKMFCKHRKHEQNQTVLNTVKPASWHQAQSALEKIILTVPGKNKTHRISIARQPQEEKQIESWGGRHVGKVLGQPKKKRNGEWKGNKTGGKVEKMWSWGRLSKLDVDICEVSTCEAVRSALIRALVDSLPNKRFTALQLSKRNEPVCHVARSLLNTCALNKWKYL